MRKGRTEGKIRAARLVTQPGRRDEPERDTGLNPVQAGAGSGSSAEGEGGAAGGKLVSRRGIAPRDAGGRRERVWAGLRA